ncbi:DUF2163 domain-containing protein [Aureimonas flava]|uniref:DUF2163 domain-containing protein n=1 Tax=Aureimonas flava TaxID=2320271 RepID=A0A3A1WLR6_9HYPH|nr:DUF2163 domain-containing protein [Aureimonas flava]RIY01296.1 DUF2163 domain-containing protein [Aureimonas flava]
MTGVSDDFRARLRQPATTLAHAWRVTRTDGEVFGFTDHDEDLAFAGTVFCARTGWTAGEAEAGLGLAAGTHAVDGALSSEAIREEDIAAGLFDGARVEIFRVDWRKPDDHLLIDVADFGEITRNDVGMTVELRGLAARLDRRHGRFYRRRCDAALGDARCRVDLAPWTRVGRIASLAERRLVLEGLGTFDLDPYRDGRLAVGTVPERTVAGLRAADDGTVVADIVEALAPSWAVGDEARVTAGCDRSFATCRERFANGLNFRGFPHIPGADAALAVAKSDGLHDGSAVVP